MSNLLIAPFVEEIMFLLKNNIAIDIQFLMKDFSLCSLQLIVGHEIHKMIFMQTFALILWALSLIIV